jgi:hypothetical protein
MKTDGVSRQQRRAAERIQKKGRSIVMTDKGVAFGGTNVPRNSVVTTMKADDLFSDKMKLRNKMLKYLEKFADNPTELTAFAVATTTYCLAADGNDPEMTASMLSDMARETERRIVPFLDVEEAVR